MKRLVVVSVIILTIIAISSCTLVDTQYVLDMYVKADNMQATLLMGQSEVTDATITVQSIQATYDGTQYVISTGYTLSSGEVATVKIQHGNLNRTLEMAAPVETTITTPGTDGTYVDPSVEFTMQWAAFSIDPAKVKVEIDFPFTQSGEDYEYSFDPYAGELSHTFPPNTFLVTDTVDLELKAWNFYDFGADDPDFNETSVFKIRTRTPKRIIDTLL